MRLKIYADVDLRKLGSIQDNYNDSFNSSDMKHIFIKLNLALFGYLSVYVRIGICMCVCVCA